MITDSDFDNIKFPYNESNKFEYKLSINDEEFNKYLETICGFLNTNGGYLIFGIKDNLDVIGLKVKSKKLDNFILKIDGIFNNNNIVGIDIESKEFVKLKQSNIVTKQITNKDDKKFLIFEIVPDPNVKYQLSNGLIYYRLGASNYFEKTEKIYRQSEFDIACKKIQDKANNDNKINIKLFEETLDEKNKQIDELNKSLNQEKETNIIYQKQLEQSIKNSDKLIQYNNNSSLNDIIKIIFPCLR